jgi:integrase
MEEAMRRKIETGSVYRRGRIWWIKFYHRHQAVRESSKSSNREDADRLLKRRMGEIATAQFLGTAPERVRIADLFADVEHNYALHERHSAPHLKSRLKHLRALSAIRAADFTSHHIERYILRRQREEASNATINRELQVLKRAMSLALQRDPPKIARAPYIRLLPEHNVRKGFLDDRRYLKLRSELPDYLKPLFVIAYHLGNRLGELRRLRWDQVDLERSQIRLNPGETKNQEGRVLPIYGEMREWLVMQKTIRDTKHPRCPYVFHHNGKAIVDFRKAWRSATKRAGLTSTLFHDLRRSAVRNMREAGIAESVAMRISGHKTRSVFERYNIISDRDLKQAAEKMRNRFRQSIKLLAKQERPNARSVQ